MEGPDLINTSTTGKIPSIVVLTYSNKTVSFLSYSDNIE